MTYVVLGRGLAHAGQTREATAAWSRALEVLADPEREGASPHVLDARARALIYLGRVGEAESIVNTLVENGYARPDFMALCRERGLSV
jgi:hypothetical protein